MAKQALMQPTTLDQTGNLVPIKGTYYQQLEADAKNIAAKLLGTKQMYPVDTSSLGNFPWYWQQTNFFNAKTWAWLSSIFRFNTVNSDYIETNGSVITTGLYNTYLRMSYMLSDADQAALNDSVNRAQAIVDTVVSEYTTMFGPIPQEYNSTPATQMSYVSEQILSWATDPPLTLMELQQAQNPTSLLGNAPLGTGKIINDFLTYLNATSSTLTIQNSVATTNAQLANCAKNLSPTPSSLKHGWMETRNTAGEKSIVPYLNISQSVANIQNSLYPANGTGLSFTTQMNVAKVDSNTVKVSASAGGSASGWIDFFTFGISGSVSYNMFSFNEKVTKCDVKITYNGVTLVTPLLSQSAYDAGTTTGWWAPDFIKQAVDNAPGETGIQFTTPPVYDFGKDGSFGLTNALIISQVPTFELTYYTKDTSIFSEVFKEESKWQVGFLGIPLVSGSQSYYNASYSEDVTEGTITVKMSPPANVTPVNVLDQLAYVIGSNVAWPAA